MVTDACERLPFRLNVNNDREWIQVMYLNDMDTPHQKEWNDVIMAISDLRKRTCNAIEAQGTGMDPGSLPFLLETYAALEYLAPLIHELRVSQRSWRPLHLEIQKWFVCCSWPERIRPSGIQAVAPPEPGLKKGNMTRF